RGDISEWEVDVDAGESFLPLRVDVRPRPLLEARCGMRRALGSGLRKALVPRAMGVLEPLRPAGVRLEHLELRIDQSTELVDSELRTEDLDPRLFPIPLLAESRVDA